MFFTFEPYTKQSIQSHEHATIRFAVNGVVSILSREMVRSVGRKWDAVGHWWNEVETPGVYGSPAIRFTEDSLATRLVATQLKREGWAVEGIKFIKDEWSGKIIKLQSDGRITNPESIKGRIRDRNPGNARDKRRKVQATFGSMGECHLVSMREAILAREAKRGTYCPKAGRYQ